ncbi:hypothetical protein [Devosia sp. A369]
MSMSKSAKAPSELAARALCRFHGMAEETIKDGNPAWQSYLPEVNVVLTAAGLSDAVSTGLEHTPVQAYFVLRRLAHDPIEVSTLHGFSNQGLVHFLISRGLAVEADGFIAITAAGRAIGEIADDRQ